MSGKPPPAARAADIAIVGGGIAGVGLVARLAGRRRVILVEREDHPGSHASGRSAAVFVPNYGDGPIRGLTRAGADSLRHPDPGTWASPLLKPRGLLRLVTKDGEGGYAALLDGAAGIEPVSLAQAQARFPILRPERFIAASFERDVHDIDVDALLQGWLRIARHGGAGILVAAEVDAIRRSGGLWRLETSAGTVEAPVLVNGAGAWADGIAAMAGASRPGLVARRRSMAVVQLAGEAPGMEQWPFVVPFPLGWYAKPDAGRLLVSPGDEDPVEPQDAFADDMVLAEGLDRFERDVTASVRRVTASWAGLRTFAPDGRPLVGFDPEAEGFFWLAGQGGFGVQTSPALSQLAASLLTDGEVAPPSVDAGAFSPARFGRGTGLNRRQAALPEK